MLWLGVFVSDIENLTNNSIDENRTSPLVNFWRKRPSKDGL
jgi:hypothetical protein